MTGDAQPIPRRLDAPLVGRAAELEHLASIVSLSETTRRCQLVTVTGPAGIGKSRLSRELAERLLGRADVVNGRCRAPGEAHGLAPLAEIVREAVGEGAAGVDAVLKHTRDRELIAERLTAALEGRGVPEHALWATRKLLECLAQRRPLVVVLDDMQWADGMLRDLVDYLVDWSRDAPLVLVCLARPELLEERPRWGEESERVHPLPLEPLSADESSVLIAGLAALDDVIRSRIAAAAEGNPLFIEQMVAMLGETVSIDDVRVPPTIHALLAARLDLLPRAERDLLERGAVLGREFHPESLVGLGVAGTEAAPVLLDALVRKQLLGRDDERYRFAHQLIRDAAYESIPKLVRAELHELVAERFADDDAIVGHHLERAYRCRADVDPESADSELAHRAATRLFAAGRASYARGAVPSAIGFFERGASLPSEDPAARAELLIAVAGALRETTEFDRAAAALEDATSLAESAARRDLVGEARVLRLRLGISIDSDLAADELRANAQEAIRELEELGDERGLGEAWYVVAWSSWLRCRAADAEPSLHRAIEYARRAKDDRSLSAARNLLLGVGLFGPMPVAQAEQRCLDVLAERALPVRVEAAAHRALGALAAMRGDFAASQACFERDRALIEDAGLRLAAMAATEVWAHSELLAGDLDAAERRLRDALANLPPGEKSAFSTLAAVLADVLCRAHRYEEALEYSVRSEEASTPDDLASEVQWRAARAQAAAALGDPEAARRLVVEAVALAATTDFLNLHGNALVASALITGSSDELERAVELFDRKGNIVAAARAREALSVLV
jgi:tetratricopeptide (TPR) repeat protein